MTDAEIREITGREGSFIDQVKVKTADGGSEQTSPSFGGSGGHSYTWKVPNGEYISKLEYRSGSWLDGITFVTNKGNKSPHFGGNGGNGYTFDLPVGARLNGVFGYKQGYLKGLGFSYKVYATPEFGTSGMGSAFSWISSLKNADIR